MKVKPVLLTTGAMQIELVGETPFEETLLRLAWKTNCLSRGNGDTITQSGMSTGFYIEVTGAKP